MSGEQNGRMTKRLSEPTRLVLKYTLVAGLWIIGSDWLLEVMGAGKLNGHPWNTIKGLLFVAVTGGILYGLARRMQERLRLAEERRRIELQEANERIQRAKGLQAVLTRANQAVLTATDETQLCVEIGAALVSLAGLRFVWFSRLEPGSSEIKPTVWAGDAPGYLDNFHCSSDQDSEFGKGAAGRAIREGRLVICRDFNADAGMAPWRPRLELYGFRSCACAPIYAGGRMGVMTAYAGDPDYFTEETAGLLTRLAQDIRHGIDLIAQRNERLRLNARLHLMQAAIEAAPSGIVIADAAGRIEWVNPAFTQMTGYRLEDIAGFTPGILKSGRQGPEFYEKLWSAIESGQVWSGDLQNQRKDRSVYWEHMVIAPVTTASGAIEHYVAIKQDITAQKQMELQVARTQRLESIGLLAGGIAHDLNNVLSPILMAMDIFKLRYPSAEDRDRFEMVRKSAERGASIVRQVLTFARGLDGERMRICPSHLIKEVRQLLCETLPRNIEIPLEIEGALPMIIGDPTQIHQVLLNLGVNARDAMRGTGGVLTFGARRVAVGEGRGTDSGLRVPSGDYVEISIRDTGCGIAPEVMERMFEPFFTTKPRGEGTGLGLSTVLGIVRGHGGGLDVTSRPGQGTVFTVLLPVAPSEHPERAQAASQERLAGRGRAVLVVDDEEPVRSVISMTLEASGFVSVTAPDGVRALELFEKDASILFAVILDRVMPRLGGEEVARRIKAVRPELPIILTSGLLSEPSEAEDREGESYRELGDVVLQKPFSQAELLGALRDVLERGKDS